MISMKSIFSDPFLTDSDRSSVEGLPSASIDTPTSPFVSVESPLPESVLPKIVEAPPSEALAPSPASGVLRSDEDPMALLRKIMVGGQIDELQEKLLILEKQMKQLQETWRAKCEALESSFRAELTKTAEAGKEALRVQNETLTQKFETAQAALVSSLDERFRKLSAASIPRSHLAEILRDVSSRLTPSAI